MLTNLRRRSAQSAPRHIQVERFFYVSSRRYRAAAVTIGPADERRCGSSERQVHHGPFAVSSLPGALSSLSLLRGTHGELVDGAGRHDSSFSDLLKRPLESWKVLIARARKRRDRA